jgi:peptidyl-prolyl cis-trans isomerase C
MISLLINCKFRRAATFLAPFGVALLLVACGKQAAPKTEVVLAKVGSHNITLDEFNAEVSRRVKLNRALPEKTALLNEMIEHESLLQKARQAGLEQDPEVRREFENHLISKLLSRELNTRIDNIQISPDDVKAEYARTVASYTQPAKVRLAVLSLPLTSKMSDAGKQELRNRMEEARAKAMESATIANKKPDAAAFGALAIAYSDDPGSRYRGGDIGWLDEGTFTSHWPREVLETGYNQERGVLSPILETDKGFFLVIKTDTRERRIRPLQDLEASIRQSLLVQRRREVEISFRKDARELAHIQTYPEALSSITLPKQQKLLANKTQSEPPALPLAQESGTHGN